MVYARLTSLKISVRQSRPLVNVCKRILKVGIVNWCHLTKYKIRLKIKRTHTRMISFMQIKNHISWPKPAFALPKVTARFCLAESTVAPALARPSSKCAYKNARESKLVNMTQILLSFFYYLNDYDFYLASHIGYQHVA